MSIRYEWCIETVQDDEVQDIVDLDHRGTYAECIRVMADQPAAAGECYRVCLIRDAFDEFDDLIDRQWSYIEDGTLEPVFDGGAKVPARFLKQFAP
jgi:hypothetical protein